MMVPFSLMLGANLSDKYYPALFFAKVRVPTNLIEGAFI